MKKLFVLFLAICVASSLLAGCVVLGDGDSHATRNPNSDNNSNHSTTSSSGNSSAYGAGMYKVGTDIEAGEYFVYCTSKVSCYMQVSSDSSGKMDSIVTNSNFDTFMFVTVEDGQYLQVTRGKFVKAADAKVPGADSNNVYGAGMYRVGIDIPAGEYKVTNTSEVRCYVEVRSDSYGSLKGIVSNDNIDTFAYITVAEGQYLTVDRGEFSPA